MLKLYKVFADYRNFNPLNTPYYVVSDSIAHAMDTFKKSMSGLKIISINECSTEEAGPVKEQPYKFVVFNRDRIEEIDNGFNDN